MLNFNVSTPVTRNAETGRFDVQINDRNAFNIVYKRTYDNNARTDLNYSFQTSPWAFQGATTKLYIGAYNWTPTASFSNEVRGGYQYSNPFFHESGVPSDFVFSTAQTQTQTTLAGIITDPEGQFRDQGRNTSYYNIQDNASYTRGNHSFRFGFNRDGYKIVALNLIRPRFIRSVRRVTRTLLALPPRSSTVVSALPTWRASIACATFSPASSAPHPLRPILSI